MSEPKRKAGRPCKPPFEKKSAYFTFRVRPQVRLDMLAAAEANGRSISEEVEHRVMLSFEHDRIIECIRQVMGQQPAKGGPS